MIHCLSPEMTQLSGIGSGKSNTPTFPVIWVISDIYFEIRVLLSQGGESLEKKKKYIYALILLVAMVIIVVLLMRSCQCNNNQTVDITSSTESNELDFTPYDRMNDTITIPGIDGLNLKSGQLQQQVDFYNPQKNKCYFKISLYLSDGTMIWQSDYIAPSEKISEINLNKKLHKGLYKNCQLVYECFSLNNKSPLNGGSVKLEINSY